MPRRGKGDGDGHANPVKRSRAKSTTTPSPSVLWMPKPPHPPSTPKAVSKSAASAPVIVAPSQRLPFTVYVDSRAGSIDLAHIPPLSLCAQVCRLASGDAMFTGRSHTGQEDQLIGVEVKSLADFVASADNGRLAVDQIPAMVNAYDESWLLVYGEWRAGDGGMTEVKKDDWGGRWVEWRLGRGGDGKPVPYAFIESRLISVASMGLKIKTVANEKEAANWIVALAQWWAKGESEHGMWKSFTRMGREKILEKLRRESKGLLGDVDPGVRLRAEIAERLPGMGFERAVAAARHFPSVRQMVAARADEWEKVAGVGKVVAKAVDEALGGRR